MSVFWTSPAWLWPLLLVLAVGAVSLTLWAYRRTRPRPTDRLARLLIVLRSCALVLLVLAIGGPVISLLQEQHEAAELLLVVEDSASMAIADGRAGAGSQTARVERWRRGLDLAARVDSALARIHPDLVVRHLRGNGLTAVREFSPRDAAPPGPVAQGSDLLQLRRQVLEQAAGRPVRAVVLFSDGQETVGKDPTGRVARSSAAGSASLGGFGAVPLIAVGVGDPQGPADRVVKDLRYPSTAYQGDEVVVEVAVDHRFTGDAVMPPLTARLHGPDGIVAEVSVPVEGSLVAMELVFRPAVAGPRVYRLEISPLDNERFLENNEASLAIDVRQERSSLLLLCDRPGWDVRFLAQAAAREQRLSMTTVYSGPSGLVHADSLVPWREPGSPADWLAWDGVVLVGWSGRLAALDWARLDQAVQDGLGLLVLPDGGDARSGGTLLGPAGDLLALLPVTARNWRWLPGSYSLHVPPGVVAHSVLEGLQGAGSREDALIGASWHDLPPLRGILEVSPGPDAKILLDGRARVRSSEPARELPVLVVVRRANGRSGWFGGRNLWELAFWESDSPGSDALDDSEQIARKLARNLLLWTAEGEQEKELAFLGRRTSYQEGERIRLTSTWRDQRGQPVTGRKLSVVLRSTAGAGGDAKEQTFPLSDRRGRPGEAEVELPPLPPGAYSVQLVGQGDPPATSRQENLVVTRHSIEATQVRQDSRRLRQLASGASDRFVNGHADEALPSILAPLQELDWTGQVSRKRDRLDLLSGWPFLLLVTVLLGVEWFLRRRHGLL